MSIVTTNMGLTIPTPSSTPGPDYASQIGASLQLIADHDHSNSAKITPAGLSITSDLSFQSNNANSLRTARFTNQASTLSGISDVNCTYFFGGNFYINNGSGVPVQITAGASTVGGGGGGSSNVWSPLTIASNHVISPADTIVNINVTTSSPITLTLPSASAVAAGRYFVICDQSGGSVTNPIALTPSGSDSINGVSSSRSLASAYGTWLVRSNGTSWQLIYTGFSGLTSAGLTIGSSVLTTSGLTAPALLISGLSEIQSLIIDASLSVGTTLGVTGAATLSSTLSAGATTLSSLTVSGTANLGASTLASLSVTGTTTLNATTLSGTMTGGTLASTTLSFPTLSGTMSGGTIDGATLATTTLSGTMSGGTISGATITGGSVGAASGIATLDSGSQLTSTQRAGWMVNAQSMNMVSGVSMSGTSFSTVSGFSLAMTNCNVGDILMIDMVIILNASAGASIVTGARITEGNGSTVDPTQYGFWTAGSKSFGTDVAMLPKSFTYTVAHAGTITIGCVARSPSANSFIVVGTSTALTVDSTGSSIRCAQYRP